MAEVIKGQTFHCSCPYGQHSGWVAVEGDTAEAILATLPAISCSHARVYQVEAVTF